MLERAVVDASPLILLSKAGLLDFLPLRGTLGLVLLAKKRRLIPAARPVMERLREAGLYLSDRTLDEALALVGE